MRSILHIDMDAFFAAIEQRDHPGLRGKPLLIGHDGPRGVVATASYEARVYGCRSAMPMAVAKRLCPQAIIVPVRHGVYREESRRVFTLVDAISPVVEQVSIDEAFVDLTGTERLLGNAVGVARGLKERIKAETGLTASVGVAENKFLAKLASDLEKPDGLTVLRREDVERVLGPLEVRRIWGIGPKMGERLKGLGIGTIAQLRAFPLEVLRGQIGEEAEHYLRLARGEDDRPVVSDRNAKSIGHEQTFEQDVGDPEQVRRVMMEQVEQVAERLRKHGLTATRGTLKIRFGDFQTVTRSKTLPESTDSTAALSDVAIALWEAWAGSSFSPVRLIGFSASGLGEGEAQMRLFEDAERAKERRIDAASDAIRKRFGEQSLRRGGTL